MDVLKLGMGLRITDRLSSVYTVCIGDYTVLTILEIIMKRVTIEPVVGRCRDTLAVLFMT